MQTATRLFKVRANLGSKRFGFVNGVRVYHGEVFEVSEKDFTPSWMVRLEPQRKKPGPKPKQID